MTKMIEEYTLAEIMQKIEEVLNENPAPIQDFNATYQFDITEGEVASYQLQLKNGKADVIKDAETPADCTLIMSLENFQQFLLGKLNGTVAFMTGKLKIKGDIGKAIKIEGILRQYNVKDHL